MLLHWFLTYAILGFLHKRNYAFATHCPFAVPTENRTLFLAALVDLSEGMDCAEITLRGLQQVALLNSTTSQINHEMQQSENLTLDLHVFDTCSNERGSILAALRALVAFEQTCYKNDHRLMAFLGPEDNANKVNEISKTFKVSHTVPYVLNKSSEILHATNYPLESHTQALAVVLKRLALTRITVIFDDYPVSRMKAEALSQKNEALCIVNFSSMRHWKSVWTDAETVLLLIENSTALSDFMNEMVESTHQVNTLLISTGRQGAFVRPRQNATKVFFLVMSSPEMKELSDYYDQRALKRFKQQQFDRCSRTSGRIACDKVLAQEEFTEQLDWSLAPLQASLRLHASALRVFHRLSRDGGRERLDCVQTKLSQEAMCKSADRWINTLKTATFFAQTSTAQSPSLRVKFGMNNSDVTFSLYFMLDSSALLKIASISDGSLIIPNTTADHFIWQSPPYNKSLQCQFSLSPRFPEMEPLPTTNQPKLSIVEEGFNIMTSSGYQLLGLVVGIGSGVIVTLVFIFYGVYRAVRVSTTETNSSMSALS